MTTCAGSLCSPLSEEDASLLKKVEPFTITIRKEKNMVTSNAAWSLKTNMRKLWADHVIWTREYLVAAIAATQDAPAAAGRLLKNQEHLGNAIVPSMGKRLAMPSPIS